MNRVWKAGVLLLALVPAAAQAASPICFSRTEATSLISYALPQAVTGTAKRCGPSLPANAFLRTQGAALASRYAGQKNAHWAKAKPAFLKAMRAQGGGNAGSVDMMATLPDDTLRQLADVFVEGFVTQRIPVASCAKLDLAIDMLSPLPPENTASLIALALDVASRAAPAGDARIGAISLCKD